ncbi:MAG TPA: alpha-hydroxy acid oxidase [Candidatus Limnocylindrales bacterium]|nr:alpha-hydroxy acid oxidase [Candidatus Limnocylindrales bacterium]
MTATEPTLELERIVSLDAFEAIAAERMDRGTYDYVAGGAWDEISLREAPEAWRRRRLRPRVLVDVAHVDPSTTMLGARTALPVAIAPMAAQGLAHPDAECAMARAAAAAGVPIVVSTMSTASLEAVAAAAPDATRWFQLYPQADPARSRSLVERAEAAGYGAIVVTVDLPTLGYRERDLRTGFNLSVPLGNFADEPPTHASHGSHGSPDGTSGFEILTEDLDRGLEWRDLAAMRSWTSLPIVLKGILTADDARIAVEAGVAGIIVSSHGARQLDRVVATADALEPIVAAVGGRTEIWVDGGIRRGLDVVTALALGARGVLVGRPMYWALAAAGQAGVERALAILRTETVIAMTLLGARRPEDIVRDHVAG